MDQQQRLDTRPKAAWVSGLREPDSPALTAKKRPRPQKKQQLIEAALPQQYPPPAPPQQQQLRTFADLGPAERQRLAELVSELGRLDEAKARAERLLAEERQLRRREADELRADLERQRRTLAELEARLSADADRERRGPQSVASQCDSLPPPQPLPPLPPAPSTKSRRRAFTEQIDREIGASVAPNSASSKPQADDDDAIVALLRQQLQLNDRTQRHLCRQLRQLSGVHERGNRRGKDNAGSTRNRILRGPNADSAEDEFYVLPEVLGPPATHQQPPPSSTSPRPESLLDIVESLDGPQLYEDEEEFRGFVDAGEGENSDGDDDSGVLEDLFFLS